MAVDVAVDVEVAVNVGLAVGVEVTVADVTTAGKTGILVAPVARFIVTGVWVSTAGSRK